MGTVRVRVAGPLRSILPAHRRNTDLTATADGVSTLVHIVESLGVPRTEVGSYLVDGTPADPGYQPCGGETVAVLPPNRPVKAPTVPPRFVADVHLGALARRLRLLGVDVNYRNDASDDELVAQANEDGRVLLTMDRGLLKRRTLRCGAYVYSHDVEKQVADVLDRFDVPLRPMSRCLRCNGRLACVAKDSVATHLAEGTRRTYHDFRRCESCGQVYWRGAHAASLDAAVARAARRFR